MLPLHDLLRHTIKRVDKLFDEFYGKYDAALYRVAQQVMKGQHAWLETGIISPLEPSSEAHLESRPSVTALAAD